MTSDTPPAKKRRPDDTDAESDDSEAGEETGSDDDDAPMSTVFLAQESTAKEAARAGGRVPAGLPAAAAVIACGYRRCPEHGAGGGGGRWRAVTAAAVRSLERHVADAFDCQHAAWEAAGRLPADPAGAGAPAGVKNSFVVCFLELRSQNSQTGCFVRPALRGCCGAGAVCVTLPFRSRKQLMARCAELRGLRRKGNTVWVALVAHSSAQGMVFSCTPKEVLGETGRRGNGLAPANGIEEFCSVHDFVVAAQNALGEDLVGVHISVCCGLYYTKRVHAAWPVPISWLNTSLETCLTGYRHSLHTTDGALLLLLAALLLAHRKPKNPAQCSEVFTQLYALAPGVCDGSGLIPALLPAELPDDEIPLMEGRLPKAALPEKPSGKPASAAQSPGLACLYSAASCGKLAGMIESVCFRSVAVRDDMACGPCVSRMLRAHEFTADAVEGVLLESGGAEGGGDGPGPVLFFLVVAAPADDARFGALLRDLSSRDFCRGAVVVAPSSWTVPLGVCTVWHLPHDCSPCCTTGAAAGCQPGCADACIKLLCALFWAAQLVAGEGWDLQKVRAEVCTEAPGLAVPS
ncbi:hypothetical protein DIPPA_17154 [Diplonema papillatum]|nr:hypothetical protein DIPPA_17154 [Diplonema papillatum]